MKAEPFRIEPTFSPRIWGARSLAPLFPEKSNLTEPIGEAWLTDVRCRIANGPFAGKSLGDAWRDMPAEWRGSRLANTPDFPLLAKFLFPTDKLSIQVHPDDAYAAVHEAAAGGKGKTEMWHVLSAEAGAKVLVGLKPGVTKDKFLASLSSGNPEDLLVSWPVSAGDTIFVPARTPHTIGPGIILCEVQQYSDLTYRVYDYNRLDAQGKPRELHLQKALDVITFGPSAAGKTNPVELAAESGDKTLLAACSYFATERWDLRATVGARMAGESFAILLVLDGLGYIHSQGLPLEYHRGDCWFIPASVGSYSVQPKQHSKVIVACVPDLAALRHELRSSGIPESRISATVFG